MVEYWQDKLEKHYKNCKEKSRDYKHLYRKWKNKTHAERQRINNLQQNNPLNNNNYIMAMYTNNLPTFHGRPGEDPADFVRDLFRTRTALGWTQEQIMKHE